MASSEFAATEREKEKKVHHPHNYHVFAHLFLLGCLHNLRPQDEHLFLPHFQLFIGRLQLIQ